MTERLIGSSLPRTEGRSNVTGQARYVDDLSFPEMLHGVTVRSSIARGSIRNIQFDPRIPWHEFTIVTSLDIPVRNRIALIADDQPCLSEKIINHAEEPVLLLLNLPSEKVRVIQTETGGAFGGKEEYPSVIACHAALLARKAGRPVKIIYDRAEDMAATTKRHPSRTRHRTAVSRDGKLLAMDIEFTVDGGAYSTLSTVVLSRGTIHAGGPYVCPNVRIRSKAVATNHPPHGAFRGFGAPQSIFALECHMDRVAKRLNMSPAEFRRRNFVHEGESLAVSQIVREPINLEQLMNRALELSEYRLKQERFARENQTSKIKRGMGFASFMHGAGFTGSGERSMGSVLAVEVTKEGRMRVLASSTEIGQGANTVMRKIAAE